MKLKLSDNGIAALKKFEGFRSKPYLDIAGVPTIGYGLTVYPSGIKVKMTDAEISESLGDYMFRAMLGRYEDAVNRYVQVDINQNQFDALVSFAYNLGNNALLGSTLLKKVNKRDFTGAAKEFGKWVYAAGKEVKGLIKRREIERALFVKTVK